MMKSHLFSLLLIVLLAIGCRAAESSLNYTKGTEALDRGDYDVAVVHLEKAVELDPKLSRNHNNLAAAYQATGRSAEAWFHVRQAVLLDRRNRYAAMSFNSLWNHLEQQGAFDAGNSPQDVRAAAGEPDISIDKGQTMFWIYGSRKIKFENGRLVKESP